MGLVQFSAPMVILFAAILLAFCVSLIISPFRSNSIECLRRNAVGLYKYGASKIFTCNVNAATWYSNAISKYF